MAPNSELLANSYVDEIEADISLQIGNPENTDGTATNSTAIIERDNVSTEELIISHRENARKVAHSLLRKWRVVLPQEEITSLVDLTLCEAASRFSPRLGASFMTFMFYYMRGNLARNIGKLARISRMFVSSSAVDILTVAQQTTTGRTQCNLSTMLAPDQESYFMVDNHLPETILIRREKALICNTALNQLEELEREVLIRLLVEDESLIDVANKLGYSRCHISRVKKRALAQLTKLIHELSGEAVTRPFEASSAPECPVEYGTDKVRRGRKRRAFRSNRRQNYSLLNAA